MKKKFSLENDPTEMRKGLQCGDFRINFEQFEIYVTDVEGVERRLNLTPLEYKMLCHFIKNEDKIFSRHDLLELFWGNDVHVSDHTVGTHISSLRRKMGAEGEHIRSIFRKGYLFSSQKVN